MRAETAARPPRGSKPSRHSAAVQRRAAYEEASAAASSADADLAAAEYQIAAAVADLDRLSGSE